MMHDNTGMMDQERQARKQGNQSRNQSLSLIITNVWADVQNGPAAYILPYQALLSEGIQADFLSL